VTIKPGPAIAAILLVGLGSWAYFKEFRGAEERHKAEAAKDKPLQLERSELKAIVIRNAGGTLRLERSSESWSLTAPLASPADRDAVEGLLASLEMGRIERRLGEVADRKTYGLDPPGVSLTLETAAGAPQEIGLGDTSPIGGSLYALLPGGREVAVVSASLGDAAKKDLLGLRDKSLLALDPWKVKSLTIERGRETIALLKPDDGWKIERPIEAPADGPTVTDLLSALERMRASRFVTENPGPADLKSYGLEPPAARVTLLQEGWDTSKTILFGKEETSSRYAATVGRDPVVTVGSDIWPKVTTSLADLRRKDLLAVNQYRTTSLTAALEGREALVLAKQKDGAWNASGLAKGPVKADTVDALLRSIAELKAVAFDDRPTEALRRSLAQRPALDLTLEQEADTEGGSPRRQHLVAGSPMKDGRIQVRDMAWGPIAFVDGGVLARIRTQMDAVVAETSAAAAAPPGGPAPPAGPGAPPEAAASPDETPSTGASEPPRD
jgi:hypothetical protein